MVTSKLTWVVRIIDNSTRRPPSAANLISAFLIANADASSIGMLSESKGLLLIANLELEFRVSPIRISELKIPNRKFSAILCRISDLVQARASRFQLRRVRPPKRGHWRRRLIENARLRSHLSPLKISQLQISNRERMAISHLAPSPAKSGLASHSSLACPDAAKPTKGHSPLPSSRNALTCRALTA